MRCGSLAAHSQNRRAVSAYRHSLLLLTLNAPWAPSHASFLSQCQRSFWSTLRQSEGERYLSEFKQLKRAWLMSVREGASTYLIKQPPPVYVLKPMRQAVLKAAWPGMRGCASTHADSSEHVQQRWLFHTSLSTAFSHAALNFLGNSSALL